MLVLIGILIIIAGFMLRFNPLLVIMVSALATGSPRGSTSPRSSPHSARRSTTTATSPSSVIVLPVIGLLEVYGLQATRPDADRPHERARRSGRLLTGYLLLRQATAAVGLTSVAGHPQTVRPARRRRWPKPPPRPGTTRFTDDQREEAKAFSAATDNIGLFFGEDIFLAIGSILLMKGVLEGYGYQIEPLHLSLWAIPTAIAAFVIHAFRLRRLEQRMKKQGASA